MSASNQSFIPFSSQLGIAGTSYRLQMGRVNDKWASRILKGTDVIESTVFSDVELPNANLIVGWCLKVIAIPNINPYQIMKTVQFLRKETERNWEESKTKVVASASEAREARERLEKVPEGELKRRAEAGWVKQEEGASPSAPAAGGAASPKAPKASPAAGAPAAGPVEVRIYTAEEKARLQKKLAPIPGAVASTPANAAGAPENAFARASASGGSAGVVKCKSCGADVKFCPVCGKPL